MEDGGWRGRGEKGVGDVYIALTWAGLGYGYDNHGACTRFTSW